MKVTLDIDKLLRQGQITSAEYARIKGFAAADTGSLALNILLGFGSSWWWEPCSPAGEFWCSPTDRRPDS